MKTAAALIAALLITACTDGNRATSSQHNEENQRITYQVANTDKSSQQPSSHGATGVALVATGAALGALATSQLSQQSPPHSTTSGDGCQGPHVKTGPKGGKFYINVKGKKVYCARKTTLNANKSPQRLSSSGMTGATGCQGPNVKTGPKGGRFYINSKGKKVYCKRK